MLEEWDNYRISGIDAANCSNSGNYWKQKPWHSDQTAQQELLVCVWHLLNPSDRNEALTLISSREKINEQEKPGVWRLQESKCGVHHENKLDMCFSGCPTGLGPTLVSRVFSTLSTTLPQSHSRVSFASWNAQRAIQTNAAHNRPQRCPLHSDFFFSDFWKCHPTLMGIY